MFQCIQYVTSAERAIIIFMMPNNISWPNYLRFLSRYLLYEVIHTQKSNNLSFSELDISIQNKRNDSSIGIGIITRET